MYKLILTEQEYSLFLVLIQILEKGYEQEPTIKNLLDATASIQGINMPDFLKNLTLLEMDE